ncbi:BTAD domain-containing putative transcriptional regulator [Embleya sp. NPDC059237]|uniref:AfsR/SARP family transcriptional regulator n=1 Tax=Embleya sp. NPDC059237 TaxID=3346784 RepID=UPI003680154D
MIPRFGVLGDIEARIDGEPLDLGHIRQRCVLAVLLVEANRVVPIESVVERVWGHDCPDRARHTLYSYVSRLRRRLRATQARLVRRSGGYLLETDTSVVDLHRFRDLAARGRRADDDHGAASHWTRSLDLWRGDAFATVDTPWFNTLREALHRERRQVELDLDELLLRRGEHTTLLPRLIERARIDPLDERSAGQLMLALYRNGRSADALAHYRSVRDRLADELGIDPSTDLQRLHQRILASSPALTVAPPTAPNPAPPPPPAPIPRQLPPAPPLFIGRARALSDLDHILASPREPGGACPIAVIGGAGGTGKTWLALRAAHRHADAFADGQLYVDLRGFAPEAPPVPPGDAVRGFLNALGVGSEAIGSDEAEQVALYRTVTTGKRLLIVLDNARDSAQVRPLLPGSTSCVVLVTSRRRLTGLVTAHGARSLSLDALDPREARALLSRRLGAAAAAEPDAVAALVEHCAGLPLALGIVAARAIARPDRPLAAMVAELREESGRLDALETDDHTAGVRAAFASSYRALNPATARVLDLLAHAPGPDIGVPAVAALTGLPPVRARTHLRALEAAHLVREHGTGRHRLHDLLRLHVTERDVDTARGTHTAPIEPALLRLVDFYLDLAHAADRRLSEVPSPRATGRTGGGDTPSGFRDAAAAIAWFETERACLRAAHVFATERGMSRSSWELALSLDTFHWRRGRLRERLDMLRATVAAGLPDEPAISAHAHRLLGRALVPLGEHSQALRHLRKALAASAAIDDEPGQARAHLLLARAWEQQGDHRQALAHAEQSLRVHRAYVGAYLRTHARRADPRVGVAALVAVGRYHARLGHIGLARGHCERALVGCRLYRFREGEADVRDSLSRLAEDAGAYPLALAHHDRALALRRTLLDTFGEADTLTGIGRVQRRLGRVRQARDAWSRALSLYRAQHRAGCAERLRALLASLGPEPPAQA